jgi:hypothetical protein
MGDILIALAVIVVSLVGIHEFRKAAAGRRRLDLLRELNRRETLSRRSSDTPFG